MEGVRGEERPAQRDGGYRETKLACLLSSLPRGNHHSGMAERLSLHNRAVLAPVSRDQAASTQFGFRTLTVPRLLTGSQCRL